MKHFNLQSILLALSILLIAGCGGGGSIVDDLVDELVDQQHDTTKPVIHLLGDATVTVIKDRPYNDAGATATDNVDGELRVTTSGSVDPSSVGTYPITYTARDTAGNTATTTRTVTVLPGIEGIVRDYSTGMGIANMKVSTGSQSTMTDSNGTYLIGVDNPLLERVVIDVEGDGYALTNKIVSVNSERITVLNVDMLATGASVEFDPSQNYTINVNNSIASVRIEADSLVRSNGSSPVGLVTADITPIDPAIDISLMPGDMMSVNSSGELSPIASFGALTVDFKDSAGNDLDLASGTTATIKIPVSSRGQVLPSTIPLFYFDNEKAAWVEEGTATLSDDKSYYEGSVTHFTTWNADYLYDYVTIKGCVQDSNTSQRLANATVDLIGKNYNGANIAVTDADGNFEITAMENAISLITARLNGQVSNTLSIPTETTDITLDECLFIGTAPLKVRLTWGENPSDLDTHVIGPNDYHIWYVNLGDYAIDFAELDVDDVSSYGPEVFTALQFPSVGRYHYSVYHFAGISTITDSPARVELTLNGQSTIFTPPAGQTADDTWWNVFDIIVDDSGNITIEPINTWASDVTGPTAEHKTGFRSMPLKTK